VYHDTVFAGVPLTGRRRAQRRAGNPKRRHCRRRGGAEPSAANAAEFELVTVRLPPLLLLSVITPPLTVDGTVVPVIASISSASSGRCRDVELVGACPLATKVIGVPLTVMVSPAAKLVPSEFRVRGVQTTPSRP